MLNIGKKVRLLRLSFIEAGAEISAATLENW